VLLHSCQFEQRVEWVSVGMAVVRVPLSAVVRAAHAGAGVTADDVRFHSVLPVSERATRQWRLLSAFVNATLSSGAPVCDSSLVRSDLMGTIAATALMVFPNSTMSNRPAQDAAPALPAVLRRAVAFMEANVDRPVTVSDIAEAARVSPRALQLAFRRRYGTTPTGYLRRMRLEQVHADLQAADATGGDTVSAIAARWGFTRAARFTTAYRAQFGTTPSQTLRS
jgi:AraC-like DNA-binding protein